MNAKAALEEVRKLVNEHFRSPEDDTKPISRIREVMTQAQVQILTHSLGIDASRREPFRNYYCVTVGDSDDALCSDLVDQGLMVRGRLINDDTARYYHCSDRGKAAALASLPPAPRLSRAQLRYRAYLHAESGVPFGDWLRLQCQRSFHS